MKSSLKFQHMLINWQIPEYRDENGQMTKKRKVFSPQPPIILKSSSSSFPILINLKFFFYLPVSINFLPILHTERLVYSTVYTSPLPPKILNTKSTAFTHTHPGTKLMQFFPRITSFILPDMPSFQNGKAWDLFSWFYRHSGNFIVIHEKLKINK